MAPIVAATRGVAKRTASPLQCGHKSGLRVRKRSSRGEPPMATATETFTQPFGVDPIHSSFGFALPYQASVYRGTFDEVTASLTPGDRGPVLEGEAKVESISIR